MTELRTYFGTRGDVPPWASGLETAQFQRFRQGVEDALAERKLRFVLGEGVALVERPAANPSQLGLALLVQVCKTLPEDKWAETIAAQIDSLLKAESDEEQLKADLPDFEKVRGRLKVRLYPDVLLQSDVGKVMVTRQVALGIAAALVFDMPNLIMNVTPEMVHQWGKNGEELFSLALSNLLSEGPVSPKEIGEANGPKMWMLGGPTPYIASHLFILPRYLDRVPEGGVLVGVPTAHALLLHPIVDAQASAAIRVMVPTLATLAQAGPSPVSPYLYWWRNGLLTRLETRGNEKNIEVHPPQELLNILEQLGAKLGSK